MTRALARKLERLESQVRTRAVVENAHHCDPFADIEQDTARLLYYRREGRWPPDMTTDEINPFEKDLRLIAGEEQ